MRKPFAIGLAVLLVAAVIGGGWAYTKYQETSATLEEVRADEMETSERYAAAINEIAVIQDSLNAIVLTDGESALLARHDGDEVRLTETSTDQALQRIEAVKAGIQRAKDRIESLEHDLHASGVKVDGLERMISNLHTTVAAKEDRIERLTMEIGTLETRVTDLTVTVENQHEHLVEQHEYIEHQREELGTVYYMVGSKKELQENGAVVASGGVLGIGKTLKPSGEVNPTLLKPLDTNYETVLRIPSKDVEVLTAQPVDSYQLQVVGGTTELRIVDPVSFRAVKHLLIMTG